MAHLGVPEAELTTQGIAVTRLLKFCPYGASWQWKISCILTVHLQTLREREQENLPKDCAKGGAWMAQSLERLNLVQVMISQVVRHSLARGSVLSVESAGDSLPLPLRGLVLSLKNTNKSWKKKKKHAVPKTKPTIFENQFSFFCHSI